MRDLVDDLVQDSYFHLCRDDFRALRKFRSPEAKALYGLVQAVAVNVTKDHFKREFREKHGGGYDRISLDLLKDLVDPSDPEAVHKTILLREVNQYLEEILDPKTAARDRRIFWLRYRTGLTAKQIASLRGVDLSEEGVESLLHRLIFLLRKRIGGFGEPEKE